MSTAIESNTFLRNTRVYDEQANAFVGSCYQYFFHRSFFHVLLQHKSSAYVTAGAALLKVSMVHFTAAYAIFDRGMVG